RAAFAGEVPQRSTDPASGECDRVFHELLLAARKMMADRAARRAGMPHHLPHAGGVEAAPAHQVGCAGQQITRAMELAAIIARNAPLGIQGTKEAAAKYVEQGE